MIKDYLKNKYFSDNVVYRIVSYHLANNKMLNIEDLVNGSGEEIMIDIVEHQKAMIDDLSKQLCDIEREIRVQEILKNEAP